MRRRTLWLLLALTAALLLAANIARGNDPTEPGRPAAESAFAERVEEGLRSWFGPTLLPPRLTLKLIWWQGDCKEFGGIELVWRVSGGVPPYTRTLDGQPINTDAGSISVACSPPTPDPPPGLERVFKGGVTDSRGVTAEDELRAALTWPPPRAEPGAVFNDASTSAALRLSWTAVSAVPSVRTYELQYQTTAWNAISWPDSWTTINDTIAAGATEYLHRNLDPNRRYRYQLRARNGVDAGEWSRTFPEVGLRPGAPLLEARTAASGSVALSWSAAPTGATRWEYRRRPVDGAWTAWTTISGSGAATTEHTVGGLTEDARYQFQLRAHTANGASPTSAIASAVAGLTPTVPSERQSLRYDDLDSTGGATRPGSYAFLKDADDLTSGAATFAEVSSAEALLLNASGYARRYYGAVLTSVRMDDRFTWSPDSRCWYHYRVTEVLPVPTTTVPARKLFRIALEAEEPCGVAAAQAGNAKSYFDESRGNLATFISGDPPNAPRVGPDGIRIIPTRYPAKGGHTYRLLALGGRAPIVIDIPEGMSLTSHPMLWGSETGFGVWFRDEASGASFSLNPNTGENAYYFVPTPDGETEPPADVVAQMEAIIASIREVPLPMTVSDE